MRKITAVLLLWHVFAFAQKKTEIKEVEKVINSKCEIDPKVPELLNKAARNPAGENK